MQDRPNPSAAGVRLPRRCPGEAWGVVGAGAPLPRTFGSFPALDEGRALREPDVSIALKIR